MTIKALDKSTIQHLHSGQVIVDLEAIVKELIENSLDANATSIEVVFINNGLESIQVKDDGDGIEDKDRLYAAQRHYTSKLVNFDDLESITSYGFRGEALNAMCTVSDHAIIATKTKSDVIGKQYDVDKEGMISNEKATNLISKSGTIVTLYKPFYNLPVRRQLAQKNTAQNTKKFQELLVKYALAHPSIRFSSHQARDTIGYTNNNNNSWIKPITASIEKTIAIIHGSQLANMVERFIETDANHSTLTINMILPKRNSDPSVIYKGGDRVFIYVNQRPINYVKSELKDLVTSIRNRYRESIGLTENNKKNPFMYVDIQLPPDEYDVNIEPNKTTIYFHNKQLIYDLVDKMLDAAYPSKTNPFFSKQAQSTLQQQQEQEQEEEEPLFMPELPTTKEANIIEPSAIPLQCTTSSPPVEKQTDISEPSARLSPSPSATMDHSWSFSMMSDDEEEEPLDDVANTENTKIHKPNAVNITPMANWQIDTVSSVTGPKPNNMASSSSPPPPAEAMTVSDDDDTTVADSAFATHLPPPTPASSTMPSFSIPQKRTLPGGVSSDEFLTNHTHKRISLPYINKQRQLAASQGVSGMDDDFAAPPSRMPTPIVHESQPVNTILVERSTHKSPSPVRPTSRSPSMTRSTLSQQPTSASPAVVQQSQQRKQATTPKPTTNQMSLLQAFSQQARIRSKLAPAAATTPPPSTSSTTTLNQSLEIRCSFDEIKSNYRQFIKQQHDKRQCISIGDYLASRTHLLPADGLDAVRLISTIATPTPTPNGLSFYSRGGVSELGVVKLKALRINSIYNQLLQDHKITCKKTLDRPVQIQFRENDPLCAALVALDTKEAVVDDDAHGNKEISYYEIIEDCIVWNGFRVRWRKDYTSHNLIIQFTGIYSLESGYGPADFREILDLLGERKTCVRPTKIRNHLWSLAEGIYEQDNSANIPELQDMLQNLTWTKDETAKGSVWELGLCDNGRVLACKLTNLSE